MERRSRQKSGKYITVKKKLFYYFYFFILLFIIYLFLFYYRKKDFKITDGIQRVYGCNDRLLRSVETERSTSSENVRGPYCLDRLPIHYFVRHAVQ